MPPSTSNNSNSDSSSNSANNSDSPIVRLTDIVLSFGTGNNAVQVLNNINLQANIGEKIALIGPSGAGKTSLLALIAGLLRPTSGTVQTLGQDLSDMDEDALAAMRRAHIGIVFQHFHLLETMTALENTALPLELTGQADATARAAESLKAVGLESRLNHFPSQLSGGERQRTAIARAFVSGPKLLLADEPTGNLDYESGEVVLQLLLDIARQQNTAMLFVTHNRDILKHFDTVHALQGGTIVT